jgi:hypothetical protein
MKQYQSCHIIKQRHIRKKTTVAMPHYHRNNSLEQRNKKSTVEVQISLRKFNQHILFKKSDYDTKQPQLQQQLQ